MTGDDTALGNIRHGSTNGDAVIDSAGDDGIPDDGTVEFAIGICCGEGGAADAALHEALGSTHNSTVVIRFGIHGVYAYIGSYGAVLYGGLDDMSSYTAHIVITGDAGIGQVDSLDGAAIIDSAGSAEEALNGEIGLIDSDAADGIALAVESTAEIVATRADGGVVVLGAGGIVPVSGVGVGDVLRLEECEAGAGVTAIVHVVGQVAQVCRGLNVIGVGAWGFENTERRGVAVGNGNLAEGRC